MFVSINGQLVPEEQAVVSVFDRGFLYGDGLFETLLVLNQRPFRWEPHWQRLKAGAAFLQMPLPLSLAAVRQSLNELVRANHLPNAVARLTLSRGVGPRGYSISGASRPTLVVSLHPTAAPELHRAPQWGLVTSTIGLPAAAPLARFKTCNKLPQILARIEAEAAKAHEALLLNSQGFVVEAASSNLFWIKNKTVGTPPLESGILPGVTRALVLEICRAMRLSIEETCLKPEELHQADGVFLTLSSAGVAEAIRLDGRALPRSPLTGRIRAAYLEVLREETGWGLSDAP
jgi:branched-chain amino acid aminotransferase